MGNGMNLITFSPIAKNFSLYYGISNLAVSFFALTYMILYPLVNFPQSNFIDNISMKYGV